MRIEIVRDSVFSFLGKIDIVIDDKIVGHLSRNEVQFYNHESQIVVVYFKKWIYRSSPIKLKANVVYAKINVGYSKDELHNLVDDSGWTEYVFILLYLTVKYVFAIFSTKLRREVIHSDLLEEHFGVV